MDEEDTKTCENCKREIPAVNYMVHTVHCARNIKMCPVCKEPIPQAELQEHHEKLHKLLPCKQCGESVCGTDLEDHIRDSCGHTIKSCRFCSLELPRRELPAHEGYCGSRTEQCAECREWVMIKYRQLHEDSNHGFLRLDDDPIPQPKREQPTTRATNMTKPNIAPLASTSNGFRPATKTTNLDQNRPKTEIRYFDTSASELPGVSNVQFLNGALPKAPLKRTNDQPQINTAVVPANKVNKELSSRGAVKKRPAPKPPKPPSDPRRDLAFASALQRQRDEEQRRQEQTAYNLSIGLPPVLSAAAKLERLRKMDALQNRELAETDYKNRLQGRVWMDRHVPIGNLLGSTNSPEVTNSHLEVNRRKKTQNQEREQLQAPEEEERRHDFKNLKPMTAQEFMNRFQEMQLRKETKDDRGERGGDRFSEIKSSLRELRRGLNEVTAPYNSNNANPSNIYSSRGRPRSEQNPDAAPVQLPCEFCSTLVSADQLVLHQTGCRPDLAQYRRSASPRSPSPQAVHPDDVPVIPCEFCTESLPLYLISEHQERCGRDANLLYPD